MEVVALPSAEARWGLFGGSSTLRRGLKAEAEAEGKVAERVLSLEVSPVQIHLSVMLRVVQEKKDSRSREAGF